MAVYMIGYDLNKEGENYQKKSRLIEKYITDNYETHFRRLDTTWLIESDEHQSEICKGIKYFLDKNDELMVIEVCGPAAIFGRFDEEAIEWLQDTTGLVMIK